MRKFIVAAVAFLLATGASAVPAKRGIWKLIRLADGTEVKAQLAGDEFLNYWQDDQGQRYVRNNATGLYDAADLQSMAKGAAEKRALARKANRQAGPAGVTIGGDHQPYVGEKKGLVVLVEFADKPFRADHDQALYKRILNEEGFSTPNGFRGSVRDYFRDQSYGEFSLDFDVVGPVTMPKGYAYYGGNDNRAPNPNSKNIGEMIETAVNAVDAEVNFADYDWDGDGMVDQVFFLYAGRGEASGGGADTIWPHEWVLRGALGRFLQKDGVVIDTYACSCEMATDTRIDGIGTICHEFSHCLGLPDMYDTANMSSGNYGMCSWDIMDQGSYNGAAYTPAGYSGWERVFAGWKTPVELTADTHVSGMKALGDNGDVYIIRNDGYADEYYLLENRQRTGWDSALDGEGLLVVHVDFDRNAWASNSVNSSANDHPHCTPIPADNRLGYSNIGTDAWPYNAVNSLTNESTPASKVYNKNTDGTFYMSKPVTNITRNADGTISFDFGVMDTRSLFYESFDGCAGKGGNDGVFNSLGANKNVGTGPFSPDNEGWVGETMGGANMCAMFTGPVTTPMFEVEERAQVTFRAAPLTGGSNATALDLAVSGDAKLDKTSLTMTTGKFTEYTVYIEGNGPVSLTFTPGKVFFLDELRVKSAVITGIDGVTDSGTAKPSAVGRAFTGKIYSIDGRYVGTDASALKSGIYIMDGRKFVK